MLRKIKKHLYKFRYTVFHPQWFTYRSNKATQNCVAKTAQGKVLDIGCADQAIRKQLLNNVDYIGLDYYQTSQEWYGTQPHIFGDAQALPIAAESIDTVLLLDVLEHIPDPEMCIDEIARVLKQKGILILQVPYIYPLHDEPLDFHRWSKYGLERLSRRHNFRIVKAEAHGRLLETSGLILNIALSKTAINWLKQRRFALILVPIIPVTIILANIILWLLDKLSSPDYLMPHSYLYILEKADATPSSNLNILSTA